MKPIDTLIILAACLAAAACATDAAKDADDPPAYLDDPRIGAKTGRACGADRVDSQTILNDGAVVFFGPRGAFLVETGKCRGLTNPNAQIALGMEGSCLTRGDVLMVSEANAVASGGATAGGRMRCPVRAIYEWTPAGE